MPSNHPIIDSSHHRFMQAALSLALRNLGQTWPNPSVGALLVKNGQIIATGYTARGGRPHAETQALADAGEQANGATLYVTLEPCAHHGKTPPCVDAIINAGIARVVIASRDPHAHAGGGSEKLRAAGIDVIEDICGMEAREINRGFFSVIEKKRPYIALKIATSLDGKITSPHGRWITGPHARDYGQLLRSRYDAIATGIGTALADDPLLTCRLPGLEDRSPVRVLFDRQGRLPKNAKLAPQWTMNTPLPEAVATLAEKGITRLLVEAGAKLSTSFLQSGLVDRIYWFRAPIVIGDKGLAAVSDNAVYNFNYETIVKMGPDSLEIFSKTLTENNY